VYTAEAIDPPEIANVQLILYPPAYTGLASISTPKHDRRLKGSTLRLDAVTTRTWSRRKSSWTTAKNSAEN